MSKRGGSAKLLARESSCIDSLLADGLSPLSETEVWASVMLLQQPRAPEQQTSEGGAHWVGEGDSSTLCPPGTGSSSLSGIVSIQKSSMTQKKPQETVNDSHHWLIVPERSSRNELQRADSWTPPLLTKEGEVRKYLIRLLLRVSGKARTTSLM